MGVRRCVGECPKAALCGARLKEEVTAAIEGTDPTEGWRAENIQPLFAKMICDGLEGEFTAKASDGQVIFMAAGLRAEG